MAEISWDFDESAKVASDCYSDTILEDVSKRQQGVIKITNANAKNVVITSRFNILVDNNRKAFNLDFHPLAPTFITKKGSITKIIAENHPRLAIGSFIGKTSENEAIIRPFDRKLPEIYTPMCNLMLSNPNYAHVVHIEKCADGTRNPLGKIVETMERSQLDYDYVVTQSLIMNEIDIRPYSADFEQNISSKNAIEQSEFENRVDLRKQIIFSIDPENTKAIDDALSCKLFDDGVYEVGVHIADVSHFVRPGTDIDEFARKRNRSIYLPGKIIQMLPDALCHNLCSLLSQEDRLAVSTFFHIAENGSIIKQWTELSVINLSKNFSYNEAERIIEDEENPANLKRESNAMRLLYTVSQKLRNKRIKDGAFTMEAQCSSFSVNKEYEAIENKPCSRLKSQLLVEEFMILTNANVANRLLNSCPKSALLLCNSQIPQKYLENLRTLCQDSWYFVNFSSLNDLQKSLYELTNEEEFEIIGQTLISLIRRSNPKSEYICSGVASAKDKNVFHSGLNTIYTHFTSPIRRYADIIVHRTFKEIILGNNETDKKCTEIISMNAFLCNARKIAAANVSRRCQKFLLKSFVNKNGPFNELSVVIAIHRKYFLVFVKRFGLYKKVYFKEMENSAEIEVITEKRNVGAFKAQLRYGDKVLQLQPLDAIWITLICDANEEKKRLNLKATINLNLMKLRINGE
ncbi:DIS3-like exonuclease 2-like isoform X1 [Dinothrombium tinctorium]|uniref:DIS3-like exonuclease 2-like isoform X1 n=1 Tax=Dinothrombium tinctorium TaxID=1965070 RepID=A0A3S3P241_9ACAR|nr:DIS3-like exonuclease 2-like isoform X1 [Dinothrombium tinctorium]RWS06408.1 DIS3-like exonuclease 2-like isoform X1 [Dinothrombium tinctorium]